MTDDITQAERDEAARVNELRRHAGLFELTPGEVAAMRRIREAEPKPVTTTQDPDVMPAHVHGEAVVSAFRHLPFYGVLDDRYTVITRGEDGRYCVFRARFAPALGRWSIDTDYRVDSGLSWNRAASEFAERVTDRVR